MSTAEWRRRVALTRIVRAARSATWVAATWVVPGATPAVARAQDAVGQLSLAIGSGAAIPTSTFSRGVATGYNVGPVQLAYLAAHAPVGVGVETGVMGFSVRAPLLRTLPTATSGVTTLWGTLVDVFIGPVRGKGFRPYLVGGMGVYNRAIEVWRRPDTTATFNSPYWGFTNVTLLKAPNATHATDTQIKLGEHIGAGLLFGWYPNVFLEVRYHDIRTDVRHTTVVPITLGLRF